VLDTGDAAPLLSLTPRNKHHAMSALANLSKHQGRYDLWLQIRQRYNLKWTSSTNSLQAMERFFNPEYSLDSMLQWVREAIKVLPYHMGAIIKFNCLVGLRPAEAVESVRLLNVGQNFGRHYYNPERQALEHFRFPEIFLRRTKKAYLSYLSVDNYQWIVSLGACTPSLNAIRLTCQRRRLNMSMHLCRKVFASWLHKSGIPDITIDMLSGRCPKSVLAQHYLSPDSSLHSRLLNIVDKLKSELEV
jgi:hypothetical protein